MCLGPEQGRGLEPQAAGEPPPRPPPWVSGDPEDEHTETGMRALEGDWPQDPQRGWSSQAGRGRQLPPVTVPDESRDGTQEGRTAPRALLPGAGELGGLPSRRGAGQAVDGRGGRPVTRDSGGRGWAGMRTSQDRRRV